MAQEAQGTQPHLDVDLKTQNARGFSSMDIDQVFMKTRRYADPVTPTGKPPRDSKGASAFVRNEMLKHMNEFFTTALVRCVFTWR